MGTAHKRRRTAGRQDRPRTASSESRAGDAVTVAWTVTVTTLVICEVFVLSLLVYVRFKPNAAGMLALVGFFQFSSLVLAVVAVALLPVVYRVRRSRPPRAVVVFALFAASVPFLVAAWRALT